MIAEHTNKKTGVHVTCGNCGKNVFITGLVFCSQECRSERLAIMGEKPGPCLICKGVQSTSLLLGVWQGVPVNICGDECMREFCSYAIREMSK